MKIFIDLDQLQFFEEAHTQAELADFISRSYRTGLRNAHYYVNLGLLYIAKTIPSKKKGKNIIFYKITEKGKKLLELFK